MIGVMNIAVDIDGTITESPGFFKEFMLAMREKGHSIHIITGTTNIKKTPEECQEHRKAQLKKYDIKEKEDYDYLVICRSPMVEGVAAAKADYCKNKNIDIIFEDSDLFIEAINKYSNTLCFKIIERRKNV